MKTHQVLVIGAAIVDVLLQPVDARVFSEGSHPVDHIGLSLGGDALNESIVLARLGCAPLLATRLGRDATATLIRESCQREGVTLLAAQDPVAPTGINAVLIAPDGERSFVTNRNGTLRRLCEEDVMAALRSEAFPQVRVVSLASLFVSPLLARAQLENIFRFASDAGKIICADMTSPKNRETVDDLQPVWKYIDYLFANRAEARLLTGRANEYDCAEALLRAGAKHVLIKLGAEGCLLASENGAKKIPAASAVRCIDTTGAGDTFAAGFIAALLRNCDPEECARYGAAAASLCVEQVGATTVPIDPGMIEERLAH